MSSPKEEIDNNFIGIQPPTIKLLLEQTSLELLEKYISLSCETGPEKDTLIKRIDVLEKFIRELVEESMAADMLLQIKVPQQNHVHQINDVYADIGTPSNAWEAARAELDPDEIKYLAGKMFDLEKVSDELLSNN